MISNISEQNYAPARTPIRKRMSLSKEDLEQIKLVHDVVDRLDYDDVKSIIAEEQKCLDGANLTQDEERPMQSAFILQSDAILAKIEKILMEFKTVEKKGTLRMMQIDNSLAALGASHRGH